LESNPSFDRSLAVLTSFVYFVQGALSLSGIAFLLYLRGRGWGVSQIATFSFVIGLPWALKLLYGAFSDAVPIQGLRRKPYLILASVLSLGCWIGISFTPSSAFLLYALALTSNLGFAVTDVVTDALIVENSREDTAQLYQSLAWGFRSFGAIVGGVLGGWLAQHLPYSWAFLATASLPVTTLVASFFIHESQTQGETQTQNILKPILQSLKALSEPDSRLFAGLLLTLSFSASFGTPFFFFLKEKLKFSEIFLGSLSSLAWFGAIIGCFFYGKFLKQIPVKKTLFLAVGINVVNILSTYGILNTWSAAALSFLGGILSYLTLLPLMASAALFSRKPGIQGSLFALFMSVHNLGQILSTFLGGKLFDIMGLRMLILVSALVSLPGLVFASRIKSLES